MAISDIPLFQALKSKMQWHQVRQGVLAENVANADSPRYRAKEVEPYSFEDHIGRQSFGLQTVVTNQGHVTGMMQAAPGAEVDKKDMFEVTPNGNNVVLEEQMMKVTQNQMDFQAATTLYSRGLGLIRTALGRSG
ncbi:flagellar basal body rod protein FlgB [Roseibium aquae]|uniref:Flagellar basal body rod protein FlgB n=1 Tax=Roseibium aquae TaxID=1323746 RepID=A0A916WW86_9HYPH|nr:flagellar basal body rod protein FlgB [Roseibium aquae]GGB37467.1 flagellar basal body rod protein FlgB [Roseibium aquae]